METDAALAWVPVLIVAIVLLIIGRFLLIPMTCQYIPLQLPGGTIDYCILFR